MRSANPALNVFESGEFGVESTDIKTMTYFGTATKVGALIGLCAAAAVFAWQSMVVPAFTSGSVGSLLWWWLGLGIATFVIAIGVSFLPKAAPVLAPLGAATQGGTLAILSGFIASRYLGDVAIAGGAAEGLIFQAITLTFAIGGGLAICFAAGLARVNGTVAKIAIVMAAGVAVYFVAIVICNWFLGMNLPNLFSEASPLGIAFSAFLLVLASIFLVLDFQAVEAGVEHRMPKHYEWVGGFAIVLTLAWIYIEVLRLLGKIRTVMGDD
ncbi:MAG: Bax inhibitor-1/YccA family protein [Planctomycetota bacterium]